MSHDTTNHGNNHSEEKNADKGWSWQNTSTWIMYGLIALGVIAAIWILVLNYSSGEPTKPTKTLIEDTREASSKKDGKRFDYGTHTLECDPNSSTPITLPEGADAIYTTIEGPVLTIVDEDGQEKKTYEDVSISGRYLTVKNYSSQNCTLELTIKKK